MQAGSSYVLLPGILFSLGVCGLALLMVFAVPRGEERIRRDLATRGCTLESAKGRSFLRHWGQGGAVFDVRYRDAEGKTHTAVCFIGGAAGIFWKDDAVSP